MKGSIERILLLIGFIGSAVTIIVAYRQFVDGATQDGSFGLAILAFFCLIILVFAIVQEYRFSRKSRYIEAFSYIDLAYQACITRDEDKCFLDVCNNLTNAFSLITGANCSCCIKTFDPPEDRTSTVNQFFISTLCRDSKPQQRKNKTRDIHHDLDRNTDFRAIFRHRNDVFYANNLPLLSNYANTSFEVYGDPKDVPTPFLRSFIRDRQWPLPYKSTIVAPIVSQNHKDIHNDTLVGFLCIDSPARGAFNRRYDVDMVKSLAIALYPMISSWYDRRSNPEGEK